MNEQNPSGSPPKRKLGRILVDGEFISQRDLERALKEKQNTNMMLGETLVNMGLLNPSDLNAVLAVNKNLSSLDDALRLAAGVRRLLGDLLLQARRITPQQLVQALQEQRRSGEKLGSVLIRLAFITGNDLEAVLRFQENQDREAPPVSHLRLGEILIADGQITRAQLDDALARQRISKRKIGEELIEAGYIAPKQLSHGLIFQKKLLTAALIAVLSLSPFSHIHTAESTLSHIETTASESLETRTALKIVYQTSDLIIKPEDILRGYIDIPTAAHIEIQNNNLAGYLIVFHGLAEPFREVIVDGLDQKVKVTAEGGWIAQPYQGRDPLMIELKYKVFLKKNSRPGTYAWPLTISVSPIIPV